MLKWKEKEHQKNEKQSRQEIKIDIKGMKVVKDKDLENTTDVG